MPKDISRTARISACIRRSWQCLAETLDFVRSHKCPDYALLLTLTVPLEEAVVVSSWMYQLVVLAILDNIGAHSLTSLHSGAKEADMLVKCWLSDGLDQHDGGGG